MLNDQNRPPKRLIVPVQPSLSASQPPSMAALPDLRGLLLVALVAAWLAGILLASLAALPLWPLLVLSGAAGLLAVLMRRFGRPAPLARWLTLSLLLLACLALGAARLTLASPVGDAAAVSVFIGRGPVVIRGEIGAEPALRERSTLLEVDASSLSLDDGHTWRDVHGSVAVIALGANGPYAPEYGDSVELQGELEPVVGAPAAAPISGASSSTEAAQPPHAVTAPAGIFAAMTFPRLRILERGGGNPALAWLFRLRQRLAQAISQSLPEPEASLLIGILLGLKTSVLRSQYALYQQSGTVHLIVTSGFKVTVLSGLLAAFATRLLGRRWAIVPLLAGICAYVVLSGAGPAAIRAGIMGALLVIAPRAGRSYNLYTSLAFAALLMSAWSPYVLWDVGFQLSLLGTLGIVLITPFLAAWLGRFLGRVPAGRMSASLLAVTLAAQLATLPIQVINFGQLSLVAPFTNLLAVPLLGILLVMGALIGLPGLVVPIVGAAVGWLGWPLLWLVYQIIAQSAALPFSSLSVGPLDIQMAWLYEIGLGMVIAWLLTRPKTTRPIEKPFLTRAQQGHRRRVQARWRLAAAAFLIAAASVTTLATLPDGRLHITWLDVGPGGQAMLIQTPAGHTVLLDGGDHPAALEEALGQRLPFWQRTIDLALLTNPRDGHLLGLLDALGHYHINQAADAGMLHPSAAYASWRAQLAQRGIPYRQIRQGATIQIEPGVILQALSPGPVLSEDEPDEDANALILRLTSPGLRVLFLGETTETTLGALMTNGAGLRADVAQIALPANAAPAGQPVLAELLLIAQPTLLVVTPTSASTRSTGPPAPAPPGAIRTLSVATTGALALAADRSRWWFES
ncbi:MAG TPA: ComEC/Rec2 family competence protein [Ktedonobacterales bacterium]|jgi:competence protein ComEC